MILGHVFYVHRISARRFWGSTLGQEVETGFGWIWNMCMTRCTGQLWSNDARLLCIVVSMDMMISSTSSSVGLFPQHAMLPRYAITKIGPMAFEPNNASSFPRLNAYQKQITAKPPDWPSHATERTGLSCHTSLFSLSLLSLLGKHLSTYCQNPLKAFSSLHRVLLEPFHSEVFDGILNLLPSTAQSYDLRLLVECGLSWCSTWGVHHCLLHR